jgi:deoxyribonuclease-4
MGKGVEAGLDRFVQNLDEAIALTECSGERSGFCAAEELGVTILMETTAGQGSSLGARFEELAFILNASRYSTHLGVCFDTCHSFAAGYDIRTPEAYHKTFLQLDECVGLQRLKLFHLNDSKKPLGAGVDRHEHIGEGEIGLNGFRLLMNDPRFVNLPMVLETPKEKDLIRDKRNLAVLRSLIQS